MKNDIIEEIKIKIGFGFKGISFSSHYTQLQQDHIRKCVM